MARFHDRMSRLILFASRGGNGAADEKPSESEGEMVLLLEHIWFSCLVGWSGGLNTQSGVIEQMQLAAKRLVDDR